MINTIAHIILVLFFLLHFRLYENYNLKWDEVSLEQKMAALKLETQKQLLNEFMLRKAQIQNAPLTYPTEIHVSSNLLANNYYDPFIIGFI